MANSGRAMIVALLAIVALVYVSNLTFVPPPVVRTHTGAAAASAAAIGGVLGAAPAVFAAPDKIDAAAKALTEAAYPFMKKIDWDSEIYFNKPDQVSSQQMLKAIDKALVMGAAMEPTTLRAAVMAHHKAIENLGDKSGVLSKEDFYNINTALGHAIAKVPENKVNDVFKAFAKVTPKEIPAFMMSKVPAQDAMISYNAFRDFTGAVNPRVTMFEPTFPGGLVNSFELP